MLAMPAAAYAQSTTGSTTTAAAAADEDAAIVVTGSLIRNPNLVSAAPVIVTTAETIQLRASNVAEEVLRDIPGVVPSIGSAVNNGNGGASYVDLRGIGSIRNIVLLDGNRIAPSGLAGRVDLNNIPLALVERVDSLTGAAVTTYGADAISGVVNFVTKQDFSGIDLQLGTSLTEQGDGQTVRADLTIGGNFDGGRGNAVLSVGYQKADPVYQGAREFSANNVDSFTGAAGGSGTAIPSRFTGVRPIDATTGLPSTNPAVANGNLQLDPTTGTARALFAPFNFNPANIFQTPFERFNMYAQAKYDVSDHLEVYARGLFSKNTVNTVIAASGVFGSPVTINLNNPYLPAGLRNQFCAANVGSTTAYQARFTPAQCAAAATATGPTDPNYRTVETALARRTTELGPRISEYTTTIFDYRAGVRGAITDSIDYDLSGGYGESENRQALQGYVLTSKARNTLLANNTTNCISSDPGCVPVNWFGPAGSISPAQAAYLTAESSTVIKTSLAQARALISGDIGIALPSATDAIGFAIGGEYRKYTASQRADSLAKTPGELGGAGGAAPDINGGYDVKEVYGELIAPLVQDKPFFENLTLEAGARYSDYKVDAPGNPSYDTFTWKAGGTWEMVQGFKVRGNYSRAVRAPNIGELFTPVTTGLTNLSVDPCAGANPVTNTALRTVCLAQGAPATSIGGIQQPTAGQANLTTGGNLNLQPETANTWTVGAVFQPSFAPGLAITADYYNITVKDAVSSPLPGDIVAACFGAPPYTSPNANSAACQAIGRNPASGGLDGDPSTTRGLFAVQSNLGRIQTDGLDVTAFYSRDIGFAKLGLTGNFNYTFSSTFNADVTSPTGFARECVGYYSVNCSFTGSIQPKWQSSLRTTLGFNTFDVSLLWRHIDKVQQEPLDAVEQDPLFGSFGRIPSYNYFDLTGRFTIVENIALILTVTNLGDKKPPLVGSSAGSTSFNSGNTYPSTYDALGRRYAAQINVRF
ncbi:TonB-dependent receptor domain-containing protein [Polymorphobacter fuscus]|uniref:TonB-dependent receptor n=1 Tax=Sandarakinorhabdus fusca TaxID=1439888 RepID=A0A7C9KZY3_9SPHN|nr:TonB-dependent receptor [Polymorphobacter fuscus]KAB7644178.1 TonB-dependent receptor [Polymorphobacter fuscus]MQT18548.1 TonB-dependent receptor [Polymorphobacter fuscus]